jgi:tetratricopeptide (TPR) repeat protein
MTYYYRQMYEEAISASKKAIALDSDNFISHWLVGRVYFSMGMFNEAQVALERSLYLDRNFYTTYCDMELTYTSLGLSEKARDIVQIVLALLPTHLLKFPDDNRARLFLASRLAIVGRVDEARAELKTALTVGSDDPLVLYNAACTYSQLGDIRLAVQTLGSAFTAGYEYADWIKRDSDLDPIRNDPEYIELMKDK